MNKARKIARKVGLKNSTKVHVHLNSIFVILFMGSTCYTLEKNFEGFALKQ